MATTTDSSSPSAFRRSARTAFHPDERQLVQHEEALVADGEDVGVERPSVDPVRMLLREPARRLGEPVEAGHGLARLAGLSGREAGRPRASPPRDAAPREQVHRPLARREARVVRGPLVGELPSAGERVVEDEGLGVLEDRAEDRVRRRGLDRAVEHLLEVRRGQVDLAVRGVARGGHRGGVRGPHRRRAAREAEQVAAIGRSGRGDDRLVRPVEAEPTQGGEARTVVRGEDGLQDAEVPDEAHLREPLQGGGARVGDLAPVRRAGDVAGREASVVVRRTDEAVELSFAHAARVLRD